ncbi:MAG: hypothetical protein ACHQQP_06205 [Gemmatimonadales bacterium]|jgi:hypothetical protein
MKSATRFAALTAAALLATGCGYRLVRNSDVTAKKFAADSASISSLQQELAALKLRCSADSIRLANELAIQTAAAAAMPAAVTPAPADSMLKARAAEIASLKDQLAKVSTELDRIKRRLANPRP